MPFTIFSFENYSQFYSFWCFSKIRFALIVNCVVHKLMPNASMSPVFIPNKISLLSEKNEKWECMRADVAQFFIFCQINYLCLSIMLDKGQIFAKFILCEHTIHVTWNWQRTLISTVEYDNLKKKKSLCHYRSNMKLWKRFDE